MFKKIATYFFEVPNFHAFRIELYSSIQKPLMFRVLFFRLDLYRLGLMPLEERDSFSDEFIFVYDDFLSEKMNGVQNEKEALERIRVILKEKLNFISPDFITK